MITIVNAKAGDVVVWQARSCKVAAAGVLFFWLKPLTRIFVGNFQARSCHSGPCGGPPRIFSHMVVCDAMGKEPEAKARASHTLFNVRLCICLVMKLYS